MSSPCIVGFHESVLAPTLAKALDVPHQKLYPTLFSDGEFALPKIQLTGIDHVIFVVDFLCAGNELIHVELLAVTLLLRQLVQQGVARVTLVMPYLPYDRADRLDETPMALVLDQLGRFTSGCLITLDVHKELDQQPLVLSYKTDMLWHKLAESLAAKDDLVVVSPDHGGIGRAKRLAQLLDVPFGIMAKQRNDFGDVHMHSLTSDVSGKTVLLRDDMVDTGKTAAEAVAMLKQQGATRVFGLFTHPILSQGAEVRLQQAAFEGIFFTNSLIKVPLPFAKVIQLDGLLTEALLQHLQQII